MNEAEVAFDLELVVGAAAESDSVDAVVAVVCPRFGVMELDERGRVAAASAVGHEATTPAVALPDIPADGSGNMSRGRAVVFDGRSGCPRRVGRCAAVLLASRLQGEHSDGVRDDLGQVAVRDLVAEQRLELLQLVVELAVGGEADGVAASPRGSARVARGASWVSRTLPTGLVALIVPCAVGWVGAVAAAVLVGSPTALDAPWRASAGRLSRAEVVTTS